MNVSLVSSVKLASRFNKGADLLLMCANVSWRHIHVENFIMMDEVCEICGRPAKYKSTDYVRIIKDGKTTFEHSKRDNATHYYCQAHRLPAIEVED